MSNFIDRQSVIEVIDNHIFYDDYDSIDKTDLINAIEALPLAEKCGQWIDGENIYGEKFLPDIKYCSVCYKEAYWDSERGQQLFPYCPKCGARME